MWDVVIDLCWGSSGKGKVCPELATRLQYDSIASINAPNAGHTSCMNGNSTVWKVLPSAASLDGSRIVFLGASSVFSMPRFVEEAKRLGPGMTVVIHPAASLLQADDMDTESARSSLTAISSTAQGSSISAIRKINRETGCRAAEARRSLECLSEMACLIRVPSIQEWSELLSATNDGLLEIPQGFWLSNDWGEYPYVTYRNCTPGVALSDMGIPVGRCRNIVGVVRSFPIRVGNAQGYSGGMDTETTWEEVFASCGMPKDRWPEYLAIETTTVTKRQRRVGRLDLNRLATATKLVGVSGIFLNFAQYIDWEVVGCTEWNRLTTKVKQHIKKIEEATQIPVIAVGTSKETTTWLHQ